jgi:hypothetical protein
MSSTERLYEYISARMYGETEGNCAQVISLSRKVINDVTY